MPLLQNNRAFRALKTTDGAGEMICFTDAAWLEGASCGTLERV
jgi:hypothetical protein